MARKDDSKEIQFEGGQPMTIDEFERIFADTIYKVHLSAENAETVRLAFHQMLRMTMRQMPRSLRLTCRQWHAKYKVFRDELFPNCRPL